MWLSREQVQGIDRTCVERFHMPSLLLMENAGRSAAAIIEREYGPNGRATVVCGPGHNGGDGCVIARHLHNAGWRIRLLLTAAAAAALRPDTRINHQIAVAMGMENRLTGDVAEWTSFLASTHADDVMIDALLGTGFHGRPRDPLSGLITAMSAAPKRAMAAVDVPSGLDCDAGEASEPAVRADLTVTFVAKKIGFAKPSAAAYLGKVVVADIGAPRELLAEFTRSCP